jgi:hypothetical protein
MICNCIHSKVCRHRLIIQAAIKDILEIRFGGPAPGFEIISQAVRKHCRYRTEEVKNEEIQNPNH